MKNFLRHARAMFLTCTVVPVVLGGALAYYDGSFSWSLFLLCLFGVSAAHLGVNLSNDYFDFKQGADKMNKEALDYSGGGDSIIRDGVNPAQVKIWFILCFVVAAIIGLVIFLMIDKGRALVASIAVLGFIGGYFYTAPPFKFAYRGLGELDIFVFLGPAPVLGTYAVLTGTITWRAVMCSMPAAGLIAALLIINEYTDFQSDIDAGKKNLVVLLGRKTATYLYTLVVAFIFLMVVVPVITQQISPAFLVALLPLPLAVRSVDAAFKHYNDEKQIIGAQADFLKVHLVTGLLCAVGAWIGAIL